jgi:hypothetical protein
MLIPPTTHKLSKNDAVLYRWYEGSSQPRWEMWDLDLAAWIPAEEVPRGYEEGRETLTSWPYFGVQIVEYAKTEHERRLTTMKQIDAAWEEIFDAENEMSNADLDDDFEPLSGGCGCGSSYDDDDDDDDDDDFDGFGN